MYNGFSLTRTDKITVGLTLEHGSSKLWRNVSVNIITTVYAAFLLFESLLSTLLPAPSKISERALAKRAASCLRNSRRHWHVLLLILRLV